MKIVRWILDALLWLVVYILGLVVCFVSLNMIQRLIYVPKEYFFTLHNSPIDVVTFLIIFIFAKVARCVVRLLKTKDKEKMMASIKIYKKVIFITVFLISYIYITNLTVISESAIRLYTPLNPIGKQYGYDDIVSVDTGVYHKKILFIRRKGQFYYKVEFSDGKHIDLMDLGKINEAFNDLATYEEIEVMDKKIMRMGISKNASDQYMDLVKLGEQYVDRFQRILDNDSMDGNFLQY